MTKLHLVMPMGGKGSRFSQKGFSHPKPLIEINGKPFFYWATQSISKFVDIKGLTFAVLQEHIDQFQIDRVILSYYPQARFVVIPQVLNGAVLTCLKAVEDVEEKTPLIFNDCDHLFTAQSFYRFCAEQKFDTIQGGLLTFVSDDPKFSYALCNEAGNLVRTREKEVISNQAICGAYYFQNKEIFRRAAEQYLQECEYQEYFVSGIYNIMAANGEKVRCFQTDRHLAFGTPQEYQEAKGSKDFGWVEP